MSRLLHNSLSIMVLAASVLASPCHAAFTNLWLVNYECQPAGLPGHQVWRVYARFSDPGDRLVMVFGGPSSPLSVNATGAFYQDPAGGNLAPNAALFPFLPALQWDTFCTIGVARNSGGGTDQTSTTPGFPPLPVSGNTLMAWFVPATALGQGAPDSAGHVMILQLTLPSGAWISQCNVGLTYRPAGSAGTVTVNNASPVLLPLTAGDLNADLQVNVSDLLLVVNTWGGVGQGIADANDDLAVDVSDLLIVINHWGMFTGSCQ